VLANPENDKNDRALLVPLSNVPTFISLLPLNGPVYPVST
jgi:hypothetical protein